MSSQFDIQNTFPTPEVVNEIIASRLSKHKTQTIHNYSPDPKKLNVSNKKRMFTYKTAETGHLGLIKTRESSVEQVVSLPM